MKNLKQIRSAALAEEHINEARDADSYSTAAHGASSDASRGASSFKHNKAADAHQAASEAHSRKMDSLIKSKGSAEDIAHHEAQVKQHDQEATKHKSLAHRFQGQKNESVETIDEAHKLGDKVKIVGGPKDVHGKMGRIGEIKHGSHKTAAKTYTVDHDAGSVQLGKEHIRAIKEELGAGEFGTAELTNKYKNATPGQSSNVTEENNFKVTFAHEHPEGEKKHEYVVKAKNQNDADHRAMALHQKAHPNGKFTVWDSQPMHEEVNEDDICETASAGLAAKAKKTGFAIGTLRKVYRRGVAAWNSGHRPGTTPQQWGMARVNSYVTKGKGTYHGADKDLRSGMENSPDKDLQEEKDSASGLPKAYVAGLSTSTAKARAAHFDKADKLSDKDPEAYKPAPGDATAKTKESEHTKKYKAMFGEDMDEEVLEACWDSHKQVGMKMKDGRRVPNCVPKESVDLPSGTDLNEASGYKQHSGTAAMHSQAAKDNPSISTHIKAANSHEKASNSHSRKLDKLIRNKASAADLTPHETMVKQHDKQVVMHKFMAHRLIKKHMNEAVEIAEAIDLNKNAKITKHSQEAIAAEKRGDKQAQQFHLAIVSKLKNELIEVTEATKETDGSEEVSMAKSQLLKVVDMAKDLAAAMDDEDELEAWIQNKITTAYNELDDVHSYVEYDEDLQDEKYDAADKDTPMDESVIAEETEDGEETAGMSDDDKKSLARLQALIRLGLLDRQSLPTISRAIKKLDTQMPINNIAEKMALFELLQSLISIITGDTSVFAKVRSSVIRK